MSRHSTLRTVCESALARPLLFGASLLPDRLVRPVSRGLGTMLSWVLRKRCQVVRQNVERAYPDPASRPDAMALAKSSLSSLCCSFLELARMPQSVDAARARVQWSPEALAKVHEAMQEGPVIFSAAHFGSYEMVSATAPLHGIAATSIVRPLDNPVLERWLHHQRTRHGQRVGSNRGAVRTLADAMADGDSVAILHDINLKSDKAVFVDFFGIKAATAPTTANLALRSGRPIVPIFCYRTERPMHFEIQIDDFIYASRERPRAEETRRILQLLTNNLEARVRRDPSQWLWTHRRWKTRPKESDS